MRGAQSFRFLILYPWSHCSCTPVVITAVALTRRSSIKMTSEQVFVKTKWSFTLKASFRLHLPTWCDKNIQSTFPRSPSAVLWGTCLSRWCKSWGFSDTALDVPKNWEPKNTELHAWAGCLRISLAKSLEPLDCMLFHALLGNVGCICGWRPHGFPT